jgi:hypothetical protein
VRNRNIEANYSLSPGLGSPAVAAASPTALKIDRFSVAPIDKVVPGAELRFTINGMPGAVAEVDIPGVVSNLPMPEIRTGVYEGAYTLKRLDRLMPSRPMVATLRAVYRSASPALTADAKPPVIRNMAPRDGEAVMDGGPVSVSGTFDDAGSVGVDPASVRFMLSGRTITADSQITPQFFTYRADLSLGRYTADVTARDLAGNAVRKT